MSIASSTAVAGLELPPLEDLLDGAFRRALGLAPASQYGIACRDVPATIRESEARGLGPFARAVVPVPRWVENGERRPVRLEFALGYDGEAQVELLGSGHGTRFYADALAGASAQAVLHHVGVYQAGLADASDRLERAGFPRVVAGGVRLGRLARFQFAYHDTREALGVYLEILDFAMLGERPVPMRAAVGFAARLSAVFRGNRD